MNVTIQWSKGKPPVMSIYDGADNRRIEMIELKDYDDKDRLTALMLEKGFRKMTQEELAETREEDRLRAERNRASRTATARTVKVSPDVNGPSVTEEKQPEAQQGDEL
jgi:phage-related protein